MTTLEHAILGLRQALESPRRHQIWRRLVRHRMAVARDALSAGVARGEDAWLAAREQSLQRERTVLLGRLAILGPQVLDEPDIETVRQDLVRLVADLERHHQHLNDLVYDAVSLELGGSD